MSMRLLALFLLCVVCSGCGPSAERPLMVGMELAYPPFEMTDADGNPAGVSVDLARALGEAMGREVQIENIPFSGLIPALKTGSIDLIISSMTATEERSQSIDFSEPYVHTGLAILAAAGGEEQTIGAFDRTDARIAVKMGTTGHAYAQAHLTQANLLILKEESSCVLEVVQGKADAFLYDQMSIYRHWARHRNQTRALLEPFQREAWAVGLRKGDTALQNQVNDFLRAYREQGGFDRLGERHLKEMKNAFEELGYPFVF